MLVYKLNYSILYIVLSKDFITKNCKICPKGIGKYDRSKTATE